MGAGCSWRCEVSKRLPQETSGQHGAGAGGAVRSRPRTAPKRPLGDILAEMAEVAREMVDELEKWQRSHTRPPD